MFEEGLQRDVTLPGVSAPALALVLEYIYTARITLSLENVQVWPLNSISIVGLVVSTN